jgi:Alanyl-tRNA synthetase
MIMEITLTGDLLEIPMRDGDRFVKNWNLVFMQYHRQTSGELGGFGPNHPLKPGMGLKRKTTCDARGVSNQTMNKKFYL